LVIRSEMLSTDFTYDTAENPISCQRGGRCCRTDSRCLVGQATGQTTGHAGQLAGQLAGQV
jgi:hypothetical protein